MTDEDILRVLAGLTGVWWYRNYRQFCELMGWVEDDYSFGKWEALAAISEKMGQFDKTSLVKIVRAGLGE